MSDNVNSPDHYTAGGIETIDIIKAKLTPEEFAGYCKGNVVKYVTRANLKGGLEDLKKADKYLRWAILAMNDEAEQDDEPLNNRIDEIHIDMRVEEALERFPFLRGIL